MKKVIFIPGTVDTGDYSHPTWSKVIKIADEIAKIVGNSSVAIYSSGVAMMLETARVIGEELAVAVEEHPWLHSADAFLYHAKIIEKELEAISASDIIIVVLRQELIYELSNLFPKCWSSQKRNIMFRKGEAAVINCENGEVKILHPS